MRGHIHHISQRKRAAHEPDITGRWVSILDKIVLVAAFIGPLTTIPQIYKIIATESANDISILGWTLFGLLSTPWLVYGFVHKEKSIIISSVLWMITDTIVVLLALVYS